MSRLFTRKDSQILFESSDSQYRAIFAIDVNKGLSIDDPSSPVNITAVYKQTLSGCPPCTSWPPCTISHDLRKQFEREITYLTLDDNHGS
jgi:hypothetical protein